MVTTVGTESRIEDLLSDLVQLDHDAADAYQAAIDRLADASYRSTLTQFKQDHLRHIDELGQCLSGMGKTPPQGGDMKSMLTQGKVVLGSMMGDKAIIQAMKTNEDDTNTAYERAVNHRDATPQVHAILERNLQDERRHREWMVDTLDKG
jgi:uncharacterized protein (TIGR02284 family)